MRSFLSTRSSWWFVAPGIKAGHPCCTVDHGITRSTTRQPIRFYPARLSPRKRGLRQTGLGTAAVIGIAQGFALAPGLSRSAMTIVFALFMGLKRRWAAEYSFFLAIPTILVAALVQSRDVLQVGGLQE